MKRKKLTKKALKLGFELHAKCEDTGASLIIATLQGSGDDILLRFAEPTIFTRPNKLSDTIIVSDFLSFWETWGRYKWTVTI